MTGHGKQLALLSAGLVLLAGCASSRAATQHSPDAQGLSDTQRPHAPMSAGMVMPDGSTMGAPAGTSTAGTAAGTPSASALMICAAETEKDIRTVLAMKRTPAGKATFADQLYTCTYHLPMGRLMLSVKQSTTAAATAGYYTGLRRQLGGAASLDGLGEAAYGTTDGTVVLRKDNFVLRVDASKLPPVFGAQHAKRNDFAYEIASDILGCWTGG